MGKLHVLCSDNLVFYIHNSVRSVRSRIELPLSAFVDVGYAVTLVNILNLKCKMLDCQFLYPC